jgi:hypothetical protein
LGFVSFFPESAFTGTTASVVGDSAIIDGAMFMFVKEYGWTELSGWYELSHGDPEQLLA